jgi:hypothetical protein
MLPLRPTASNWIKFLLLLALLLLVTIVVQGDRSAKDQTQINNLEKEKKEWIERDKEQDTRLKKLEQSVKKLKTSKVHSPKTTPKQVAVAYPVGCERYRPLFERYDWDVRIAMAISASESGCNPNAVSPTNDHGLMQLHGVPIYDPAKNIEYAYYHKYRTERGWYHWTDYTNGKYLRYL